MLKHLLTRSILGCVALTLSLTSCTTVLDPSREDLIPVEQGTIQTTQVETRIIEPSERGDALLISGTNEEGDELSTEQLRGQPVLINAWASWCAPCIEEAPIIDSFLAQNPQVQLLGLRVNDGSQEPPPPLQPLAGSSISDTNGQLLASIPNVPPKALPSTTLLDAQGRIAAQHIGPVTESILNEMLQAASVSS